MKEAVAHTFGNTINAAYQGGLEGCKPEHGNNDLTLICELMWIPYKLRGQKVRRC